jgi:V/A-type H+-transporting ATPase subunit C
MSSPDSAILDAYFRRFIVWNLKIILRSKALKLESDEITQQVDLYPEELVGRRDIIARTLSAKDLIEAVEQLGKTEFGDDAAKALALYNEKKELQVFDLFLDRALFKQMIDAYNLVKSASARRMSDDWRNLRELLGFDIDGYNVTAALRAKAWGLTAPQARALLIEPAFMIRPRDLELMLQAESVSEAAKTLQFTPYRELLGGVEGENIIQVIERGFNRLALRAYRRAFANSIFGVTVVLSTLKLREEEVRNISLIIFGVDQGMGSREIMSRLELT